MTDPVCALLGCRVPVLQGAMSLVSNPELVAAVSNAGGFGVLASAPMRDPEMLRQQIAATRALTRAPFGVNMVGFNPLSEEMAKVVVECGIRAVTGSAGFTPAVMALMKAHAIIVAQVVPSVALARKAEAAGVDIIIAEGTESGGAQGANGVSTLVLVPAVVDAVRVPVIAAGGIADRRGFCAALALGAVGVQMGSRFLTSRECIAHAACKQAICAASEQDTTLIPLARFNARVVRSKAVEAYLENPDAAALDRLVATQERVFLDGALSLGPVAAGQTAGLIHTVKTVADIISEMTGSD